MYKLICKENKIVIDNFNKIIKIVRIVKFRNRNSNIITLEKFA